MKSSNCSPARLSAQREKSAPFNDTPHNAAFTLPELLISIAIFGSVITIVAGTLIQTVQQNTALNLQRQVSDDARFVMEIMEKEIKNGMIDFDEYYNKNVLIGSVGLPTTIQPVDTYGQNYGAYYSTFFNPGDDFSSTVDARNPPAGALTDPRLGFDCNNDRRNNSDCATPLRNTIDRNTGNNPYLGKLGAGAVGNGQENAFCGRYTTRNAGLSGAGCAQNPAAQPLSAGQLPQSELYLISADGRQKTILAREMIGPATWALALLRMNGNDRNGDGVVDEFFCAPEFQCRGDYPPRTVEARVRAIPWISTVGNQVDCTRPANYLSLVPRAPQDEQNYLLNDTCENPSIGFNKDFVPLSPTRVTISDIKFYLSPLENPHYAFSEVDAQLQPSVTIVMTVQASPDYTSGVRFQPITLVKTVYSRATQPIVAPVLVEE